MDDDAMRSMNFSKLNQDIGRTVNQALEEARRQFGGYRDTDFLSLIHILIDSVDILISGILLLEENGLESQERLNQQF